LVSSSLIMPGLAAAAAPTFPDNVVVFPERDFVTIEGYQDHIGQDATVTVTRAGQVVGSAVGKVAEGDVAFEINHPGGYCWGAGTNLKVTPDIRSGDTVTIKFADGTSGDTKVGDVAVDQHAKLAADGKTVTIEGHIAAGVSQTQLEQRVVNPDLTALVGRRDVRALPGPLTPAPKGGYSSSLEFPAAGRFLATYVFDDPKAAEITANTGVERLLSWEVEDADANRQALTISEFGEAGGPGMGGCPLGPSDAVAPAGSFSAVRSSDKTKLQVNWTPTTAVPDATAVSGYSIEAIAPAAAGGTLQTTIGARTDTEATQATLVVDPAVADYTVEVRSLAGAKMSEPFTATTAGGGDAPNDTTVPTITATPAPNTDPTVAVKASSVTLTSAGNEIYFTVDGTSALDGDLPSDTAKLYTGPILITAQTEVHWAAFTRGSNTADGWGTYAPEAAPPATALAAPANLTATQGSGGVTLKWDAVTGATGYQVQVYEGGTLASANLQPVEISGPSQVLANLPIGKTYQFAVKAKNAAGFGAESTKTAEVKTVDRVTIGTAKWKTGDFRVTGSSNAPSGTVTVWRVIKDASGADVPGAQVGTLTATLTAAPPAAGTTYDWRLRTGVPTTNPGRIFVKSSNGGIAGPFTVTNG
jgi:hypothetical protein